jgi:hypothetical protein
MSADNHIDAAQTARAQELKAQVLDWVRVHPPGWCRSRYARWMRLVCNAAQPICDTPGLVVDLYACAPHEFH